MSAQGSSTACPMSFGDKHKMQVNGVDQCYVKGGEGDHAILCIPGALGTALEDFTRQLEFFSGNDKAGSQMTSSQ